jgi:hypothetical protein
MNKSFAKSRCSHLLFAFLFAFVGPTEHYSLGNCGSPQRAVAVDFQTFEKTRNRWNL